MGYSDITVKNAIITTLCFFDTQNTPMTPMEIWKNLFFFDHNPKTGGIPFQTVYRLLKTSKELQKIIRSEEGFYFLKGREKLVRKRKALYLVTYRKFRRIRKITRILSFVPFVQMIAVVNSLSFSNAPKESDIDLMICSKHGRIWTARFFTVFLTQLFGMRRHKGKIEDRLCLSFFITDSSLDLARIQIEPYDIYLVYFITHAVPVFSILSEEKMNIFARFFQENRWIKNHLPNAFPVIPSRHRRIEDTKFSSTMRRFFEYFLSGGEGDDLERILKKIQIKRIYKKQRLPIVQEEGTERITIASDEMLKFHEIDRRNKFRIQFEKKFEEYFHALPELR